MDELSRTRYSVEGGSFYSMQQNWREEIQQLFSETKNLEIELRDKEEQLKTTAMKQKMSEEIIRQKENKLKHREIELVHRELQLVLMKPTESPLKHGKSKLFGGVLTTKLSTGEQISLPTGFRNLISVKNVKPYNASQSPPTSPHGYRSELRVLVFDKDDDNGRYIVSRVGTASPDDAKSGATVSLLSIAVE
uniref:Uncharacterized protein n=1 Tax=Romanomermis culicivorax TaxID=13658 RepID=A0A915K2D0_ROMCU